MKKLFGFLLAFVTSLTLVTPVLAAPMTYGSGEYTNLCGGPGAAADTCNKGCNPTTGTCSSNNPYVVSYTCNGKLSECRDNESSFGWSKSLAGTACGKTVQIDVFDTNCRVNGQWVCQDAKHLKDFMVWYSGDCPGGTASPTSVVTNNTSTCDALTVVSGANTFAPATVTIRARGTDKVGSISGYRFYFGDGTGQETTTADIQHKYNSSGQYTAVVDIKDSQGVWKTSNACQVRFTVLGTPLESHKSSCSDLFVLEKSNTPAPAHVSFKVHGYDNKGGIKRYKVDFGNGIIKESDTGLFDYTYDRPGTYKAKGYIQDSQGTWKGGESTCERPVYVNTEILRTQPKTGTPTLFTLLALGAGVAAGLVYFVSLVRPRAQVVKAKRRRKTRKK